MVVQEEDKTGTKGQVSAANTVSLHLPPSHILGQVIRSPDRPREADRRARLKGLKVRRTASNLQRTASFLLEPKFGVATINLNITARAASLRNRVTAAIARTSDDA